MSIKGNEPAYPVTRNQLDQGASLQQKAAVYRDFVSGGMTKREMIAAMCLQGLCASAEYPQFSYEGSAWTAVEQADALLAALEARA